MKTSKILSISMGAVIFSLTSCMDLVRESPQEVAIESEKDITGTWKIKEAYQNESDVYRLMDFSSFRIDFAADNTYSITNYLPFIVEENGNWALDDVQYPFFITLNESGGEEVKTSFDFPINNGQREIRIRFSPGCTNNSYQYVLERVAE